MNAVSDKYLLVKDVAEQYNRSVAGVRRLIRTGAFPAYKIGGSVHLVKADVEAYFSPRLMDPAEIDLEDVEL